MIKVGFRVWIATAAMRQVWVRNQREKSADGQKIHTIITWIDAIVRELMDRISRRTRGKGPTIRRLTLMTVALVIRARQSSAIHAWKRIHCLSRRRVPSLVALAEHLNLILPLVVREPIAST